MNEDLIIGIVGGAGWGLFFGFLLGLIYSWHRMRELLKED